VTIRAVAQVAVECDLCGRKGPASATAEEAEQKASALEVPIQCAPTRGRHICRRCYREIATGGAPT